MATDSKRTVTLLAGTRIGKNPPIDWSVLITELELARREYLASLNWLQRAVYQAKRFFHCCYWSIRLKMNLWKQ